LIIGVLAGPGVFNLLNRGIFHGGQATSVLMMLAQFGGLILMFLAGLETDVERMRKASVTAFLVALSGVIWPFLLGAGAAHAFGLSWGTSCFLGGALTVTSVSISARTLMDAGKMATPEASVILGAAVIDDVLGLFVLAFLAASTNAPGAGAFGIAPAASFWLEQHVPIAVHYPLLVQMLMIAACVALFFVTGYGAAKRWRSASSSSIQALRHRICHQLRAGFGAVLCRHCRMAGQRCRNHWCIFTWLRFFWIEV
jgi:Kef-type K+ transport system membrane component KefB